MNGLSQAMFYFVKLSPPVPAKPHWRWYGVIGETNVLPAVLGG